MIHANEVNALRATWGGNYTSIRATQFSGNEIAAA